jgi:hypothetical protein
MRYRATSGERWTDTETDALEQMKSSGCGYKRIAATLDRTRDAVRSKWRELIGDSRSMRRDPATETKKRSDRRRRARQTEVGNER